MQYIECGKIDRCSCWIVVTQLMVVVISRTEQDSKDLQSLALTWCWGEDEREAHFELGEIENVERKRRTAILTVTLSCCNVLQSPPSRRQHTKPSSSSSWCR